MVDALRIRVIGSDGGPPLPPSPSPDGWPENEGEPAEPPPDPDHCPVCESDDIHRIPRAGISLFVIVLLTGVVLLDRATFWPASAIAVMTPVALHFLVDDWRCRTCGHRWS